MQIVFFFLFSWLAPPPPPTMLNMILDNKKNTIKRALGVKDVVTMFSLSVCFLCLDMPHCMSARTMCYSSPDIQQFISWFLTQFDCTTRLHKSCSICAPAEIHTDAWHRELWVNQPVWSHCIGRTLSHSTSLQTNCTHCLCNYFEILCQQVSQVMKAFTMSMLCFWPMLEIFSPKMNSIVLAPNFRKVAKLNTQHL